MLDEVMLTVFHNDPTFIQQGQHNYIVLVNVSRLFYPDIPVNNITLKCTNCITLYTGLYYIGYEIIKNGAR